MKKTNSPLADSLNGFFQKPCSSNQPKSDRDLAYFSHSTEETIPNNF